MTTLSTKLEDRELLRRFLLKEVSEQERDEIEELYFSDREFLERLLVAEEELVDDYLKGDLPAREREKFERQYSDNPVNRREVAFSRALHRVLDDTRPPREGWWRTISNFLFPGRLPAVAWVGLAVLLAVGGLTWWQLRGPGAEEAAELQARGPGAGDLARQPGAAVPTPTAPPTAAHTPDAPPEDANVGGPAGVSGPRNLTPHRPPRARPRGRETAEAPAPQPPYEVSLHSGVTLGATSNAPPPLVIARAARRVRLRVQVVKNDYQRYRVSLQAVGGGRVWEVSTPKGRSDEAGEWVTVSVPTSVFKTKDYILRVSADAPGARIETLALRQLRVERE